MDKTKILDSLKVMLGMNTTPVSTFAKAKLKDGSEVSYENLEVGSILNLIDADGKETPAPADSYELEDGTIVTVDETGAITEVKPVEEVAAAEVEVEVEKPEETKPEETQPVEDRVKTLEEEVAGLKQMIEELLGTQTEMKSEFAKQNERVTEIANAPAAVAVHVKAESIQPMTMIEKLKAIKSKS